MHIPASSSTATASVYAYTQETDVRTAPRIEPSHNSDRNIDSQPGGQRLRFDRANQALPQDLSNLREKWFTAKKIVLPNKAEAMATRNPAMLTVTTPITPQTRVHTTSTFPPTPTDALLINTSATFHRDIAPMPNWAIGLLGGLVSFGLVLAVLLYLINFPPRLQRFRERAWLRSRHKYARVAPADDFEMKEYGSIAMTSAAEKQARPRKRNKLSIDTSQTNRGLGIAVPGGGEAASPAVAVTCERRQSYDEEKLALRSQRPMSPARFAWEAVTAPIPTLRAFSPRMDLWQPRSSRLSKDYGISCGCAELESGTFSPSSTSTYGTPLAPSISQPLKTGNVFERLGERVEYAADRLGRMLSAQIDGKPEEGLLLPVEVCDREDAGVRGSGLRGVC